MRTVWIAFGMITVVSLEASAADPVRAREPVTESSLTAAKRQLDALKAGGGSSTSQKGEFPNFSMPSLQTGPVEEPRLPRAMTETATPQKKSANWLIDAMEKKSEKDSRGRERERNESELDALGDEKPSLTSDAKDSSQEQELGEQNARRPKAGPNPLDRFMGDWMTAKDLALLQPNLSGTAIRDFARPEIAVSARDFSAEAPHPGTLNPGLDLRNTTNPLKERGLVENPYLQTLNLPPSSPAAIEIRPPLTRATPILETPVSPVTYPAETAVGKPTASDRARPAVDEKHFKQLKRF